jgi:hypothetical protein
LPSSLGKERLPDFRYLSLEALPSNTEKIYSILEVTFIHDVIVIITLSGKGLGCKLLLEAVYLPRNDHSNSVYIEHNEENIASVGIATILFFTLITPHFIQIPVTE